MSLIKTPEQIEIMRVGGKKLAAVLGELKNQAAVGTTGDELDKTAEDLIRASGARPAFLGYNNYPATICLSLNNGVVHGIPFGKQLKAGDIVSIDVGLIFKGYYLDSAVSFVLDPANPADQKLVDDAQAALQAGIDTVKPGIHLGDIQSTIEESIKKGGYGNVRTLTGHGIGTELHEPPQIPNFGRPGEGMIIQEGMTFCLEPMITLGGAEVETDKDGWTIKTRDHSRAAHVEHTLLVTSDGAEILTQE